MKNIIYWYNDGEDIHQTLYKPNISHVIQKISSIGIPNTVATQYNYKNKYYNIIMTIDQLNNTDIVDKIMKSGV